MKRHIPTFEQFVNEATDADGFNPQTASQGDIVIKTILSLDELLPGKEYILTIDGKANNDMMYSGYTGGVHIFNEEDHNAEPVSFTDAELSAIIAAKGVSQVAM